MSHDPLLLARPVEADSAIIISEPPPSSATIEYLVANEIKKALHHFHNASRRLMAHCNDPHHPRAMLDEAMATLRLGQACMANAVGWASR